MANRCQQVVARLDRGPSLLVEPPALLLDALLIVDVGGGAVPLEDATLDVNHRHRAREVPAVHLVLAAQSILKLPDRACALRGTPALDHLHRVGGMDRVVEVDRLARVVARVREEARAQIFELAIGRELPYDLWNCFSEATETLLAHLGLRARGLLAEQLALHRVGLAALNRIADRAAQDARVNLVFDEIVLRAPLHRLQRGVLVVQAGEHQDRHPRRPLAKLDQRLQPLRIGQR